MRRRTILAAAAALAASGLGVQIAGAEEPCTDGQDCAPATNDPVVLRFSEFYAPESTPLDLRFSDKLRNANGKRVVINGFMAPPLKPNLDFFVLTRIRLAVCPFCSTAADWPEDIVLVTLAGGRTVRQTEEPITVIGSLEVGDAVDTDTGFFSLLRLRAESVDPRRS